MRGGDASIEYLVIISGSFDLIKDVIWEVEWGLNFISFLFSDCKGFFLLGITKI